MEMKCVKVFDTGEVIPEKVDYRHGLDFANGTVRKGDTVCIWLKDDSLISGKLTMVSEYELVLLQDITERGVRCERIAYIAKKENGKWKLMREATDGKA